eukprot:6467736-Amphidinium_carterae.1
MKSVFNFTTPLAFTFPCLSSHRIASWLCYSIGCSFCWNGYFLVAAAFAADWNGYFLAAVVIVADWNGYFCAAVVVVAAAANANSNANAVLVGLRVSTVS